MNQAQMLKGLLDGCILKIISKGETYGYKITEELNRNGFDTLNEGTVYPVLVRLEKKYLVKGVTKKSPLGPNRKYFTLTNSGNEFLETFITQWKDISSTVNTIMKGGDSNDV